MVGKTKSIMTTQCTFGIY